METTDQQRYVREFIDGVIQSCKFFLIREMWEVGLQFKLSEYLELLGITKSYLLTMKFYGR